MNTRHFTSLLFLSIAVVCSSNAVVINRKSTPRVNGKKIENVYNSFGKLEDGTWIHMVCIEPGMMGTPNIADPAYLGKFMHNGKRCYAYKAHKAGSIFNDSGDVINIHTTTPNARTGILSDGREVRITCIKKGAFGMPNVAQPNFVGQYSAQNGDRCYVFTQ